VGIVSECDIVGDREYYYDYEIVVYELLLVCGVSSFWEIAREDPVEGVSCGSRELLEWTEKKDDCRGLQV
jgi:hypothetical protein